MDGLRPQENRQQARRTAPQTSGGGDGWGSMNNGGGLSSAPGAALDAELVRQTLATTTTASTASRPLPQAASKGARTPAAASSGADRQHHGAQQTPPDGIAAQPFDVYVVLDFEATCERNVRLADPEVIEFPMVLVDARTATPVAEFQRYVRPVRHPILSDFCTELTGITQNMVATRDPFPVVYQEALAFLASAGLGDAPPQRSYCVVTCGDWDLKVMLPAQMSVSGQLGVPVTFKRWCNLKKCMGRLGGRGGGTPSGMPEMLKAVGLPLQGRHHSGIDDCRNIAAVLCALLRRGHVVDATFEAAPPAARWHAVTSPVGANSGVSLLPPLESLVSSLADGVATAPAVATAVREAPPRTQPRTEKPQERPAAPSSGAAAPAAGSNRRFLRVDTSRDAVAELLDGGSAAAAAAASTPFFTPADHRTISKFLSTLLRHKADQWRVPITANGYVLVEDALRQPQVAKRRLTAQDVAVLVRDSDKQRFRLCFGADDGRLYIAAAQGHSLAGVEPELRAITDAAEAPVAVHGTYWPAWRLIEACGYMSPMTRQHIHFAKGLMHDDGVISGMRKDVQILIYLDVPALLADGVPLLESSNGVLLTAGVADTRQLPLKYVAKVVDRQSGRKIYPLDASK